ncbi:yippee-like protein [Gonapodya prolifera JEL478]|uniref:Protein yippee-like n=1 Tax=Gonapodya prolifera (strain JEL478) TaxID=1344416 RepID=A0A139AP31_GONPJ|nr:yippee-like protein [Gonapodya prolifera JEL478]|eukprot:KXS18404.1 yippee-like protein [Gonapodya prolifera JEL478]
MGQIYRLFLDSSDSDSSSPVRVFGCNLCGTHLSTHENIVSKTFQGHHGRAWLFHRCVNVVEGTAEERNMTTGLHIVRDIGCAQCGAVVGWKYEKAYESSQKYKEGKFILERALLCEVS